MSVPPGKGKGRKCPTHKNTRKHWCDCCSKPDDNVCGLCKLPILAVNLSSDDDTAEENPQVDTCRCFLSLDAWNASVEAMDCGSPRTTGFSTPPSAPSLHTPSTSRSTLATPSTSRSTLATPSTSRSTLATPSTSRSTFATPSTSRSTAHTHNLDVAKVAEKLCSLTEAKSKDSKDSKQSTPEMTSSSDGYALSSEDRFTVRSNKVPPKVRKEYNRGQPRKLKTSPEKKTCDVKSESRSSSEDYKLRRRSSNILTFGNSGGNKTSEQGKERSSKESAGEGESDYTRRSSSQEGQNYNMGQLKDKFYTSPDSDNTYNNNNNNNERVIYINVNPSAGTSILSNQANENDFISSKENFPFHQGYRPPFPRPFPQYQVPPIRVPVRMQRFPAFPGRFRAPVQSTPGYQYPYGGSYYGSSLMPLPKGQKLDVEKVEHEQKVDRIKKWLETIETLPVPADKSKDELLTPPPLESEEKCEIDPSNKSADIYDEIEEAAYEMSESDDEIMDYPKKARREKE